MADDKKKIITSTNKSLIFLVIISWIITAILFLSGFKKINSYIILAVLTASAIFIYQITKKKKSYDIYRLVEKLRNEHYQKNSQFLDTRDFQSVSITPDSTYIYLPFEGLVAYFEGDTIKGLELNHPYRMLRRQEKSKLFLESIKYLGAESRLKQTAEAMNVDLKSLGIE